jgi:hypothetical protein
MELKKVETYEYKKKKKNLEEDLFQSLKWLEKKTLKLQNS